MILPQTVQCPLREASLRGLFLDKGFILVHDQMEVPFMSIQAPDGHFRTVPDVDIIQVRHFQQGGQIRDLIASFYVHITEFRMLLHKLPQHLVIAQRTAVAVDAGIRYIVYPQVRIITAQIQMPEGWDIGQGREIRDTGIVGQDGETAPGIGIAEVAVIQARYPSHRCREYGWSRVLAGSEHPGCCPQDTSGA